MPVYVVEHYESPAAGARLAELSARISELAGEMTRAGEPVRFLRSTFIPSDETCFHVVEARSRAAVVELCRRATVPVARISLAVEAGPSHDDRRLSGRPQGMPRRARARGPATGKDAG